MIITAAKTVQSHLQDLKLHVRSGVCTFPKLCTFWKTGANVFTFILQYWPIKIYLFFSHEWQMCHDFYATVEDITHFTN